MGVCDCFFSDPTNERGIGRALLRADASGLARGVIVVVDRIRAFLTTFG